MRVAGLTPVVAYLGRAGAPVTQLLRRARLPACLFDRPETLIPTRQARHLMEESALLPGFENVARLAGRRMPIEGLGVFGRLVRRSRTVQEAIETAIHYMPAFDSGSRWWLERRGRRARLCHEAIDIGQGLVNEYRSCLAANVVGLAAEPSDEFEQADTAVMFPESWLRRSLPATPHRLTDGDLAEWEASAPARDFLGSLQQAIEGQCYASQPRIRVVADAVGVSVRSLQRRLAHAGVRFGQLLAHERFDMAVHLLEQTDATILDIALDLGYSDHAHFTRAFRRWTGIPPFTFRRMSRDARTRLEREAGGPTDRFGAEARCS